MKSHSKRVNQHQITNVYARDLVGNKLFKLRFGILSGVWEHFTKMTPTLAAGSRVTVFLAGIGARCLAFGRLRFFFWSLHCCGVLGPYIGDWEMESDDSEFEAPININRGIPRQIDQWFTPSHFWFCWNLVYRVLLCPEDDSGIVRPVRSTVPEI